MAHLPRTATARPHADQQFPGHHSSLTILGPFGPQVTRKYARSVFGPAPSGCIVPTTAWTQNRVLDQKEEVLIKIFTVCRGIFFDRTVLLGLVRRVNLEYL